MVSTVQTCAANTPCRTFCAAGHEGLKKISYTLRNRRTSFDATDCTDLPAGIFQRYDQVILQKRCLDPFEEPRADRILTELQADRFILIGALTEGAVKATALGLLARGKNVTVLVDAIGSCNKAAAKIALRHIWAKGAKLTYTPSLLSSSRRIIRLAYKTPNIFRPS
jgi:nicotinamidase-related amidase